MRKIIQISDTHFGTEIPDVMQALEQCVSNLAPDIVLLVGDITQRARKSQFASADAFMKRLQVPVKKTVPGNHDIPLYNLAKRFLTPYANYKRAFVDRHFIWADEEVCITGLDTTHPLRHTRGKLEPWMGGFVREHVQAHPRALHLVCIHQPLVLALPEDTHNLLIRHREAAAILAACNTDIMLSGHVHVPVIATTLTHYPELPRHFVVSGSGTAISQRVRDGYPNSFNIITVHSPDELEIALWQYEAQHKRFSEASHHRFRQLAASWKEV